MQICRKTQYDIVDYIKENISIQEVVDKLGGLKLQKKGKTLSGNCPTNHPSQSGTCFNVITEKNFCYCHNCGKGGSVIDLVMLAENLDFHEAINWFKKNYNLGNIYDSPQLTVKSQKELDQDRELKAKSFLLEALLNKGKEMLFQSDGVEALKYLTGSRKFDKEIIKKTELFYLPPQSQANKFLLDAYPKMGEQIKSLKLDGHYGDIFRLAFPYRDRNGRITGLIKRATNSKGISGTTYDGEEFKDQRFDASIGLNKDDLFGLHKIKKQETIIIVEGYFDAIYLFELGLSNIVAVGQGKLSKNHLSGLSKKGVKNVIISFDNDLVGPENTSKAVRLLYEESDITPFVLDPKLLSPLKDPDEYVREKGLHEFKLILDKVSKGSVWLAKHELNKITDDNDLSIKQCQDKILELTRVIKSPIDIDEIIETVSKKLKLNKSHLKALFKTVNKNNNPGAETKEILSEGKFWKLSSEGIQINITDYISFVVEEGFSKYYMDKDYTFIKTKDNIVTEHSLPQIKDHIFKHVADVKEDDTRKQLLDTLYSNVGYYFNEGLIECIRPKEVKFKRDSADNAFVYYKNAFVNLKKHSDAETISYEKLDSPIWGHLINERSIDLIPVKYKKAEYEQFLWNVSGGQEQRFLCLCSAIGYMLHDYKEESNTKAVILCDQMISENPNGRTGKSLIGKALEKVKNASRIDGKNFKFKDKFTFEMVKLGTQIIDFNDVEANFDFEKLFSVITDNMSVEYKHKPTFTLKFSESPKIMLSTNYTIRGEGSSYKDRMFEIEFSDYYNAVHKPKDDFGHDFFSGWNENEWNRFDNFMLECLQLFLDEGLLSCPPINLNQRKLIDQTSEQFVEFAENNLVANKEYNLTELFSDFKKHIGFEIDMFDKCPIKQNTFSSWLPVYAKFKGLDYNKRPSNGKQFVKLAA